MIRDPMVDPRVGDVVQVIPSTGRHPSPLTILAVSGSEVVWERRGHEYRTLRRIWTNGATGCATREMRLVYDEEPTQDQASEGAQG